jgi:hypothetical protein
MISVTNGSSSQDRTIQSIQSNLTSIQQQFNSQSGGFGVQANGQFPSGLPPGSYVLRPVSAGIGVSFQTSSGLGQESVIPSNINTDYVTAQSGTGAPTTTQFATDGQYGWYENTNNGKWYFVLNEGGAIVTQDISTLSGNLGTGQHGDLSGDATAKHVFTQIGGTITDLQHGTRSGGTLHAEVTDTVDGFMIAADKQAFDTLFTTSGTASNNVNVTGVRVNGTRVVSTRSTGWSITGTFTSNKTLSVNTSTITTAQLADIVYTLVTALNSAAGHGLLGP